MSENDINDVDSCGDCGSCDDGNDKVNSSGADCCGGDDGNHGHSHKQADLKTLIFVLVLILAGAVAAHSLLNKNKNVGACGADRDACGVDRDACSLIQAEDCSFASPSGTKTSGGSSCCPASKNNSLPAVMEAKPSCCPASKKPAASIKQCPTTVGETSCDPE